MGASESFVSALWMPMVATNAAMIPTTTSDARNDSTGNQANVLSDLRTAHDRLAMAHEV